MTDLQSWQWPAADIWNEKIVPFTRLIEGRLTHWEAIVLPFGDKGFSYVLLRHLESNEIFCVCDAYGYMVQPYLSDSSQVRMVGVDALAKAKIARLFFLNSSGDLCEPHQKARQIVMVRSTGTGTWGKWPPSRQTGTPFNLFEDQGLGAFLGRSALDVWQLLHDYLKDPHSDVYFARDWLGKTHEQCEQMVWSREWQRTPETKNRLRAELGEWLRCLLLCNESIWQTNDYWILSVPDPDHIWLSIEEEWEDYPVPDELRHAIEQLWQRYAPFDAEVLSHECAFEWKQSAIEAFKTEAHAPTAHERLEAMLRWRDWQEEG